MTRLEGIWFYDPVEDRLLRRCRGGREEVPLTPLQHRLVVCYGTTPSGGVYYRHYRPESLASPAARRAWMEPDLLPLP